jgi:hypothetical protein
VALGSQRKSPTTPARAFSDFQAGFEKFEAKGHPKVMALEMRFHEKNINWNMTKKKRY